MYNQISRRQFLKSSAITGTLFFFSSCVSLTKKTQPDILLIMPDQMRGDCLSILKHPAVRTPNLDQLAREGALFRRAYTTVASCIPARYALLTGLYPQTSGVVGFKAKPFVTPPLPELLARAGYATVLVGRNMHQVPESGDCGYQKRILGSTHRENDEYHLFLKKAVPEVGGMRAFVEDMGLTYNHWQAKPWPLAHNLHPTEWVVNQSLKVLEKSDKDKPLFLTTSFYAPHPPLFPPKKFFDKYKNIELPTPAFGNWVDREALSPEGDEAGHRVLLQGEILNTAMAGYFGLIEHIDNQIGALIHNFKDRSEKAGRPWIIVFTTDHGEMLGDHGYFRKCEPFEGAANIPFIIAASPQLGFKKGQHIKQPVCLEDVMPTLLAVAGTKSPARVDGVNLVPTMRGQKQTIREWLHFEHATCYSEAQAYHALTDGCYKYIWRPLDGREFLFNLENDIKEEKDLAIEKSHRVILERWRGLLIKRLANRPEGFSKDGKLVSNRPYPPLNNGLL